MFRRKPPEPIIPPEWAIVGLGNPGAQYTGTRHNVGYEVIDLLSRRHGIKLGTAKHQALYGIGTINGTPVAIIKPMTFMNLSGQSVAPIMRMLRLKPDHLLVIADDLDLDVGRVRLKPKGGAGGHNGHKSLIQLLGTQDYPRIKIGIGKGGDSTIDHVLTKFHPDERKTVQDAVEHAADGCEVVLKEGVERALSFLNDPEKQP